MDRSLRPARLKTDNVQELSAAEWLVDLGRQQAGRGAILN